MWKSCTDDAFVADGFALTGGCKVVQRVFALSVALIVIGERSEQTTTRSVESSLLHATVASDSLASQTG